MKISTDDLIQKYNTDAEHVHQVKEYCEKLVIALEKIINFSEKEKEYLYCAALLHDIGYAIEKKSHHKHSLELILQNDIENFSKEELEIIANIARYHRNSLPDEQKHPHFAKLSEANKKSVRKLASILRIADGMDKPHKNLILRIEVFELENCYEFHVKTVGFKPKLEAAKTKSDLFEHTFKKPVEFFV